jgi:hypothetical protein
LSNWLLGVNSCFQLLHSCFIRKFLSCRGLIA